MSLNQELLTRHHAPDNATRVSRPERKIGKMMPTVNHEASEGEACQTSRPISWPVETGPRYPQVSHYRARYYDQNVGRFTSEDPIAFNGGINFYRYVRNSPIDNSDPTGLTTYKGFPADLEAQIRNAVDEALKKLRNPCPSGGCAGADGSKVANAIENATFIYKPKQK